MEPGYPSPTAVPEPAWRWVVVLAGGVMGCVAMGALFALPVVLSAMDKATGWGVSGIGSAMTFAFLSMAVTSMAWGAASDRFGARPVVLLGAALFALSLWAAGQAQSLGAFQAIFGLLAGGAVAAFFAPMMATVTGWFTTRRGLAVSLVSAGMGLAPVTMSPLAAHLIQTLDWRGVFTTMALIVALVTLPLALLLRPPPAQDPAPVAGQDAPDAGMSLSQAVTSAPFLILVITNFFCCATHSGPIFHTVSYAQLCGLSVMAAVSIYSVEGIAGMFGRLGFGVLGDHFGAKRVLATGLFIQALGAGAYALAGSLWQFYAVGALFGFVYAGIMPLYAVLIRENFPMRMMGTIMGGTGMAGSLGMASGPWAGGWIYETTGGYGAMYLTCLVFGFAAFAVMMTFRPFPKPEMVAAT